MITALQSLYTSVVNFFTSAWNWLTTGIYDVLIWSYTQFIEYYTLAGLKFKLFALTFGWDIAKSIIIDMQLSQKLQAFFSVLPPDVSVNVTALRIPEGIGLILTAYITRYVLRFIPGGN
jgi:hypothetical protein